ncbi:MAG: OmpA family protein, partial [Geminicoccaceae bacterium]|nr:OmpA family protein [Geminicoccaceae bacterium]
MRARRLKLVGALALLGFAACATTPRGDPALDRLEGLLDDLQREAAGRAGRERALAELALQRAREGGAREREHLLELAERRIEIARAAAEAERLEAELAELERERDRILLEASRRDAELARLEAEKLRLQSLARAEEAERLRDKAEIERRRQEELAAAAELARAEAERAQRLAELRAGEAEAARREAALAQAAAEALRQQLQNLVAREEARGLVMTLGENVFAPGSAELRPEARANLARVLEFIRQHPGRPVRIEGHTDASGNRHANLLLSRRRAEAVRRALIEEGIEAERLEAIGLGE